MLSNLAASNSGGLTKTGAGTVIVSGTNGYAGATAITGGTLQLASPADALPAGTAAYYTFNNTLADASGNGNLLKAGAGVPTLSATGGPVAGVGAVTLNGASSLVTSSGAFPTGVPTGNSSYTISAWVNVNNNGNDGFVGWGAYGTANAVNAFRTNTSATLNNYWWGNDYLVPTASDLQNTWNYVTVTYDATTGLQSVYQNGALLASDTRTGHNATAVNFAVGVTNGNEFFNGSMADLLITSTALSQAQVQSIYNIGIVPVGTLPTTTPVSIAGGATFDLAGNSQQIVSLADSGGAAAPSRIAMPAQSP